MKNLFAPWRMEVLKAYEETSGCILCHLQESKDDSANLIVARSKHSFVVLNKFPYANGHLMIVPNKHRGNWTQLSDEEVLDMNSLLNKGLSILRSEFKAEAFNIGTNLGQVAGAGIPDHVHQHLVPRWTGDVNFMPLFAEVKVISEHLTASCEKLRLAWRRK